MSAKQGGDTAGETMDSSSKKAEALPEWLTATGLASVGADELRATQRRLADGERSAQAVSGLLRIAELHYHKTSAEEAIQAAGKAKHVADELGDLMLRRRTASVLGALLSDFARYPQAAEALTEALALARQTGRADQEVPVLTNLSTLMCRVGQYRGAIIAARKAMDVCELDATMKRSPGSVLAAATALDVALAMRDPNLAGELMGTEPVAIEGGDAGTRLGRTIFLSNRARLFVMAGDLDRSRADVERAVAGGLETERLQCLAGFAEGVVDCAFGRGEAGMAHLEALKEKASKWGSLYQDALIACAEGAELAGRPDRALRYLRDVAELQRSRALVVRGLPSELAAGADDGHWSAPRVLAQTITQLETATEGRVTALVNAAIDCSMASGYDVERVFRVGKLTKLLALAAGMGEVQAAQAEVAGRVYDVGMMAIPGRILSKDRGLSAGEAAIVHEHTKYGAEIIRREPLDVLALAAEAAMAHHENWKGDGYPGRLSGEAIPLIARIVAVCDCFDAMVHARPHRPKPLSVPAALREIEAEAGRKFDPALAAQFVQLVRTEFWIHDDLDEFLASDAHDNQYVRTRHRMNRLVSGRHG